MKTDDELKAELVRGLQVDESNLVWQAVLQGLEVFEREQARIAVQRGLPDHERQHFAGVAQGVIEFRTWLQGMFDLAHQTTAENLKS